MSKNNDFPTSPDGIANAIEYFQGKSSAEIENIISDLHSVLEEKKKQNVCDIYEKFVVDITALGYETIHDFIAAAESFGIIKSNRAPRRPIPIRYRSKRNPEDTWTGRGKQPKWLQALVLEGHKIEEFEVNEVPEPSEDGVEEKPAKKTRTTKVTKAKPAAATPAATETVAEPSPADAEQVDSENESNEG